MITTYQKENRNNEKKYDSLAHASKIVIDSQNITFDER